MKTVTYGTLSAPFLATRTLLQLSRDEEKSFPLASPVLRENFYMDDVLCDAASLMEAKALKNQLSGILKKMEEWNCTSVVVVIRNWLQKSSEIMSSRVQLKLSR
ncbi:uncharacterized protein TNCV_4702371 [Trichonephila clavipes]|nr:uncharacterized protein TNCV_4702371 [Trichonephila clavipes]